MRVKHFAGYGSVEVKKVSKKPIINGYGENKTKMVLQVKGNVTMKMRMVLMLR